MRHWTAWTHDQAEHQHRWQDTLFCTCLYCLCSWLHMSAARACLHWHLRACSCCSAVLMLQPTRNCCCLPPDLLPASTFTAHTHIHSCASGSRVTTTCCVCTHAGTCTAPLHHSTCHSRQHHYLHGMASILSCSPAMHECDPPPGSPRPCHKTYGAGGALWLPINIAQSSPTCRGHGSDAAEPTSSVRCVSQLQCAPCLPFTPSCRTCRTAP